MEILALGLLVVEVLASGLWAVDPTSAPQLTFPPGVAGHLVTNQPLAHAFVNQLSELLQSPQGFIYAL